MDEQPNLGDREQHLPGAGDIKTREVTSLQSGEIPSHCGKVPISSDASAGVKKGRILQSLLSRPLNEMTDSCPYDVSDGSGQCRGVMVDGVGHRPRSRSMGTAWWTIPEVTSSASHDSLRDELGSGDTTTNTESLIEVARCKLMTLHTSEDYSNSSSQDYSSTSTHHSRLSSSQPGSPPRIELMSADKLRQHRKYSEGSRLKACLQGLRTGFRTCDSSEQLHPVDYSCGRRRRKFEGVSGLPYARPPSGYPASNTSTDEGLGDDSSSSAEQSILKSILIGRCRSNTISACGSRSRYDALGNCGADPSQRIARQPVALAKKNLHPVTAKINDCVNQVVSFIRSVPEITQLSSADQRAVIAASLHRLLLLFMAESNVHFVVAPVLHNVDMDRITEDHGLQMDRAPLPVSSAVASTADAADFPTLQFAESVRSFVSKCQSLSISTDEYHLMKLIALFQSAGSLGSVAVVADEACCAARHALQQLIERNTPTCSSERAHQRYSSLLLTIYTLSGVHCGMLDTLFCRPVMNKSST